MPSWFPLNGVPVIETHNCTISENDTIILGEDIHHQLLMAAEHPARKVLLVQNHFYMLNGLRGINNLAELGICAVISTGDAIADYIHRRYPQIQSGVVHISLDRNVFRQSEKRLQICFFPRKRSYEVRFIQDLFSSQHSQWSAIDWIGLHDVNEETVARTLGESAVYLSLARLEGVGMAALEAMSCGCAVVGFNGVGGREYATSANGYWAAEDDLVAVVDQLATCIADLHNGKGNRVIENGLSTAMNYNIDRMTAELSVVWKNIMML